MKGYNLLTKRLLDEGHTAENHPSYVRIGNPQRSKENPLDNWDGGFIFDRIYAEHRIYKSGCGKLLMGKQCVDDFGVAGVDWCHENDNPVFSCPYHKPECEMNDERLYGFRGGGLSAMCWCVCHPTAEPYDYENSIEKAWKEWEQEKERKYQEYSDARRGRVCQNHMYFNDHTEKWNLNYDPKVCGVMKCQGQYIGEFEKCEVKCPIMGKPLDKQKGNVFYDLKVSFRRTDLDGTFFEGQIDTQVYKGKRVFKQNVSMDICRNYVKLCKDDLRHDVEMQHHSELFFAKYYGRYFSVEVLNIRAEQRQGRDLMQDLQDIRDGIQIIYEDEEEKKKKQRKHETREKSKEAKIKKMEKRLLDVGYENMDTYEQKKACKLIGFERLDELEAIRQQKLKEEQEKPVQMSLFDMM